MVAGADRHFHRCDAPLTTASLGRVRPVEHTKELTMDVLASFDLWKAEHERRIRDLHVRELGS